MKIYKALLGSRIEKNPLSDTAKLKRRREKMNYYREINDSIDQAEEENDKKDFFYWESKLLKKQLLEREDQLREFNKLIDVLIRDGVIKFANKVSFETALKRSGGPVLEYKGKEYAGNSLQIENFYANRGSDYFNS